MKNLLLGGALGSCLAVVVLMMLGLRGAQHVTSAPIDGLFAIYADVDEGEVEEVTFRASWIYGRLKDGRTLESYATHAQVVPAFTDRLLAKGVRVAVRPPPEEDLASRCWPTLSSTGLLSSSCILCSSLGLCFSSPARC